LNPKWSLSRTAVRPVTCSTSRSPPVNETVEPGSSIGDFVMMCSTPFAVFGPYSAAPGGDRFDTFGVLVRCGNHIEVHASTMLAIRLSVDCEP
jgi:hypothetical protein